MGKRISIFKLLSYQLREKTAMYRDGTRRFDWVGAILSLALTAVFVGTFVYVFSGFAEMYLNISVNYVVDKVARVGELLTIGYAIVLLVCVVSGINSTNREMFNNPSIILYTAMPIRRQTIYTSKLVWAYFSQLLASAVVMVPFNVTIGLIANMPVSYYVTTAIFVFVLPLLAISLASILALPVHFLSKKFGQHYILILVVGLIGMVVAFLAYMNVLKLLQQLLVTGEIRLLFTAKFMDRIMVATSMLVPCNWLANITLGISLQSNLLYVLGYVLVSIIVSVVLGKVTFSLAVSSNQSEQTRILFRLRSGKPFTKTWSLVRKEFITVLRTPTYAMQYLGVAILMPLLVYLSLSMGNTLIKQLVYIDCSFELALALTVLFGTLTNTFCATNISRDGDMINCIKAMPIKVTTVVYSKVLFCVIVAVVSNLANAVVLAATGLSLLNSLFIFAVGLLVAFAEICFATRLDINHPNLAHDGDVISDSNGVVSSVVLIGLATSLVLGGSALYFSIVQKLLFSAGIIESLLDSTLYVVIVVGAVSILLVLASLLFLLRGLANRLNQIGGSTK